MKNLQKNKTKILLKNALLSLLEEKSFEEIKVMEICEKAYVHKTTFYNHFEDKYDLLNYVIKEIQKTISTKFHDTDNIVDYYLNIAKEYIKNIKSNSNFYKAALSFNQNSLSTNMIFNILVKDVKNKVSKFEKEIPANYVAIFYVSAVLYVISEWVLTGMKESEEELINFIKLLIIKK